MTTPDFSRRSMVPELMDTEATEFEDYRACIANLGSINTLFQTHRPTVWFLEQLVSRDLLPPDRPLRIVDVASGYGDMLRAIESWARDRKIAVELTGVDMNPMAARAAAGATPPDSRIAWVTGDVFEYRPDHPIDLIISAQFTHHLTDDELVHFLGWMEATAGLGWFVNDLHRHWLPYHVFRFWSWAARWHRYVQTDGPISISRAFVRADWQALIAKAGLGDVPIALRWFVPFRLCVARFKGK
jgi:SAM-dependent methyltransferase